MNGSRFGFTLALCLCLSVEALAQYSILVTGPADICGSNTTQLSVSPAGGTAFRWFQYAAYPMGMPYTTSAVFYAPPTGYWICEVTTSTGTFVTSPVLIRTSFPSVVNSFGSFVSSASGCSSTGVLLSEQISKMYNMSVYNSYQWKRNGLPIAGATSWSYTATTSGTYTLETGLGCGTGVSNPVNVTVDNPLASPVNLSASGPLTFCTGGSVVLTVPVTASTYQWKRNGTNISGATASSYTATTSGNYTCVITNACNSVTSNSSAVTVNPVPSAIVTASGPTTFCSGGSVTLSASTGAGYSYQWALNGSPLAGVTASAYTATSGGNYIVTVTASGCQNTSSATTVTVNPVPSVSFSGLATSYTCQSPPVTLTGSPAGGTFSGPGISGAFMPSTLAVGGPYTITYTYTNSSGCTSTSSQNTSITSGFNCLLPQNLTVVSTTGTTVTVRWDYSSSSSFQIRYKKPTSTTYTTKTFSASACQNTYTLTGLKKNTAYQINVRSYCSAGTASAWSNTVTVTTPAARIMEESETITLSPNPASDMITLHVPSELSEAGCKIQILDAKGMLACSHEMQQQGDTEIDVRNLPAGVYFVRVIPVYGNPETIRFVKQ